MRDQRRNVGEAHHSAKLTEEDVRFARLLYHVQRPEALERYRALTVRGLAEKFGVAEETMHNLLTYRTWRHVQDDWSNDQ